MRLIHISHAGPDRWLFAAGKAFRFEDHPYCGPIVLTTKGGDPAENQPPERHPFWTHVNAWYRQGKRTQTVGDKTWCVYETDTQAKRKAKRRGMPSNAQGQATGAGVCARSPAPEGSAALVTEDE
ncbi:MAG: hypothetical protein NDI84_02790 [Steroidobacteraceae bacterium]|nr:hypothetical protein [Steroidobacteraceae bacterium]